MRRLSRGVPNFNPRSPHGERRHTAAEAYKAATFQSTLPARGATWFGSDGLPAGEGFQSTLPARGATRTCCSDCSRTRNFNPRSPHGERHPARHKRRAGRSDFNPRSPHGERRGCFVGMSLITQFQSTLPARGATHRGVGSRHAEVISIHAPRTGSDHAGRNGEHTVGDFNPRSPHGERHQALADLPVTIEISIHAPRTGSDPHLLPLQAGRAISIHAPRTGSDTARTARTSLKTCYFNPRSPHGERRQTPSPTRHTRDDFNPRSPHGERR